MVKQKRKKRKSKKKSKRFEILKVLKAALVLVGVVLLVGFMLNRTGLIPKGKDLVTESKPLVVDKAQKKSQDKEKPAVNNAKKKYYNTNKKESGYSCSWENGSELPFITQINQGQKQLIKYKGYTVLYNKNTLLPDWVAYELTREEANGKEKRSNKFTVDPTIKGRSATNADYKNSGYDRGHMAPAADMGWGEDIMRESFYFTNICPQSPSLNRGVWKELEEQIRRLAIRDSAIWVVTGPVSDSVVKRIGPNKVVVPKYFYKIILSPYKKNIKGVGFVFENKEYNKRDLFIKYAVTIDSVESLTKLDFFPALPDDIEEDIESVIDTKYWVN